MTEPTCEDSGCRMAVTHAESFHMRIRYWCEKHTPWSGHYEYCPDPCLQLMKANTTEVTAGQMDLLRRMAEEEPALRALLASFERRNQRITVLENLADDMTAQRDAYRSEARNLRAAADQSHQRTPEQRESFFDGKKCGHFIVIRDYDKLVKRTAEACKRVAVAGGLGAEDRIEALVQEIERLRTCPRCYGTGVIDDGNNELPCDCPAGLAAKFNVAGIPGPVSGADHPVGRRARLAPQAERHLPDMPRAPCNHVPSGQRLYVQDGHLSERSFVTRRYVEVAVCKLCRSLYVMQ